MMRLVKSLATLGSLALLTLIAACSRPVAPTAPRSQSALDVMERVLTGARECWVKSGDPAFRAYRLDAELSSFSGKPRILLVRKGSSDIRPLLVVMAEGQPVKLQAFGPLMNESLSGRIGTDVKRWSTGSTSCR